MGRSRSNTRRTPKARARGFLELTASGFGFVSTAEGDFFIPASKTNGAFDGDLVEVALSRSGSKGQGGSAPRRPAARVLRVIERAHDSVVGRYEVADPFGVVVPLDAKIPYDIFTMRSDNPDIAHGALVRVRMVEYPSRRSAATGVVEEVLGMAGEPGADIEALIAQHKLQTSFSEAALDAAASAAVDELGAFAEGYVDERDRFAFTIDPFDARDFDDAISWERIGGGDAQSLGQSCFGQRATGTLVSCGTRLVDTPAANTDSKLSNEPAPASSTTYESENSGARWKLGVHIADVSHYVPWGGVIDADAKQRATSVYLVDRVLPMLPEALSCEVCSLLPGKPRRAFTVDILLDEHLDVLSVDCHLGIIESKVRLSYDQAQCYIEAFQRGLSWQEAAEAVADKPVPSGALPLPAETHEALFEAIAGLSRFAHSRARKRELAGGLDFETAEAKVQLDADGRPTGVVLRTRTDATSCVEEAMILANECVAKRLRDTQTPGLFRVHEPPAAESLAGLVPILQEFGYDAHVSMSDFVAGNPTALQAVLARAQGRAEAALITSLLLRAQQRAVYKPECLGHFGLALDSYCHFTSPIRRYPDLVVHRMLRTLAQGRTETYTQECDSLGWLAEHSSKMERIAEDAARQSQELKLVEYMGQFAGELFDGVVSGVATYGLFVQLENTAEGLVPVRSLGSEYFAFDPSVRKLVGQDTGASYRLGQRVTVRVLPISEHSRKLEFELA